MDYVDRIARVAERAREERAAFDPPESPESRATEYAREGVGEVVAVYVELRSNGWYAGLETVHRDRMEQALNDWLSLYARCYGVDMDASFTLQEAGELFVQTHNVRDVAALLTQVPGRA